VGTTGPPIRNVATQWGTPVARGNVNFVPQVGDILEFAVICKSDPQISVNVLHYRTTALAGGGVGLGTLATELSALLAPLYKDLLCEEATYEGVSVRKINPVPAVPPAQAVDDDGPGTVTGESLPTQVCGIITKRTALAGRRYRGRIYLPFPGEADNTNAQTPIAAYATRAADLITVLDATQVFGAMGVTTTIQPVLWSKFYGSYTAIVKHDFRSKWANQRRRGSTGAGNVNPLE